MNQKKRRTYEEWQLEKKLKKLEQLQKVIRKIKKRLNLREAFFLIYFPSCII